MYTRIVILTVGLLATIGTQAQQVKVLTLAEAMQLGVTNSNQLMLSEAKIAEAQAKVSQARDQAWPEFGVSGTYMRINQPKVTFANPPKEGEKSPLAGLGNLSSIGLAQASASVPIFAGFKIHNNKRMAHYLEEAARYDAATTEASVKLNTAKAFYQYYELQETYKVLVENLKQQEERVKEFKNLEQQQLLARNDRLKAELLVNNVKLSLTEVDNNVSLAAYNLVLLLGLPDYTTITLDTTGMFSEHALAAWDEYLQGGLANRNDLKSLGSQQQAAAMNYAIAKAGRYPSLALTGGYINAYIPNVLTVNNALNAGISLKYSLTGAIHAAHVMHAASARQKQVEASQRITSDQISLDVKRKYLNVIKAQEKLVLMQQAIEQAQENFDITKNKFTIGLVILSDYLDADVLLLQAQINYATAKADGMIAYLELQESAGKI